MTEADFLNRYHPHFLFTATAFKTLSLILQESFILTKTRELKSIDFPAQGGNFLWINTLSD